jgi:hypothetical protein
MMIEWEVSITENDLDELEACRAWKSFLSYLDYCCETGKEAALGAGSWDEVRFWQGNSALVNELKGWAEDARGAIKRREVMSDAEEEVG